MLLKADTVYNKFDLLRLRMPLYDQLTHHMTSENHKTLTDDWFKANMPIGLLQYNSYERK